MPTSRTAALALAALSSVAALACLWELGHTEEPGRRRRLLMALPFVLALAVMAVSDVLYGIVAG